MTNTKRQTKALKRLEVQLESGVKSISLTETAPLTDKDIKRIKKEIETLKSRV